MLKVECLTPARGRSDTTSSVGQAREKIRFHVKRTNKENIMSLKSFSVVAVLAISLAFSLTVPHPVQAADQNVTLEIEGMT